MEEGFPAKQQQALSQLLLAEPSVVAAVLFGSVVAERIHAESDLDLAVLFGDNPPNQTMLERLHRGIEQLVARDVDLIVLNGASTILAHQILKTGTLLFCRQPLLYQEFVVRHISEYADFKRIRQPIEEAVIARRIYARS